MSGGPGFAVVEDGITMLAALWHAARPLTADELAAALDWPLIRVTDALALATKEIQLTPTQLHALRAS